MARVVAQLLQWRDSRAGTGDRQNSFVASNSERLYVRPYSQLLKHIENKELHHSPRRCFAWWLTNLAGVVKSTVGAAS